jgi:hypothetical protein
LDAPLCHEHTPAGGVIYARPMRARGLLFVVLAAGLLGIGVAALRAGVLVVALAAAVLGVWMGDLARRDLRPPR